MMFQAKGKTLDLSQPALMGALNVTPDSFSDGGRYLDPDAAVVRGLEIAHAGARIIDVGGESTRPGAMPVSEAEEKKRVIPVIAALSSALSKDKKTGKDGILISVDTSKPAVAEAALDAGADMVNDVTGFRDARMRAAVGKAHAGAVVMHMQGTPRTMQFEPRYGDVMAEVRTFLQQQAALVGNAGASGVMVDPGIGFGKTLDHNLTLLGHLERFADLGYPLCVGVSRKRFIGTLTGEPAASRRLEGSLVAVAACVMNGANVLRVHDVAECKKAVDVAWAVRQASKRAQRLDELRVEGIVVKAHVGILAKEKKTRQPIIVNVVAFLDLAPASASCKVSDALDYRRIVETVEKTAASRHWPLLEGLAVHLALKIKGLGAARVSVQVIKPESLPNGVPSVTVER